MKHPISVMMLCLVLSAVCFAERPKLDKHLLALPPPPPPASAPGWFDGWGDSITKFRNMIKRMGQEVSAVNQDADGGNGTGTSLPPETKDEREFRESFTEKVAAFIKRVLHRDVVHEMKSDIQRSEDAADLGDHPKQ